MHKAVLDTNVLISALLFGGTPRKVLELVMKRRVVGVTSPALVAELTRILKRKFAFSDEALRLVRRRIERGFFMVTPNVDIAVLADDADNRVLEAAVAGECEFVVTGDKALLALVIFRTIQILTPARFLGEQGMS